MRLDQNILFNHALRKNIRELVDFLEISCQRYCDIKREIWFFLHFNFLQRSWWSIPTLHTIF